MDPTDTYTKLMQRALRFVSFRRRSQQEVVVFLEKITHKDSDTFSERQKVVDRLIELRYIDDKAYAESFIRDRLRYKPRGMPIIRHELHAKGIAAEIVADAIAFLETEGTLSIEDAVRQLISKKLKSTVGNVSLVEKKRLIAYLLQKGFPYSTVSTIVDEYCKKD